MDSNTFVPQMGMDVIGSDGEKVGDIDAVEQDYFVVRKGFFFPSDHYIPFSAVDSYDDNAVYLNVTKDGALDQQWGEPPMAATGTYGETSFNDDTYTGVTDTDSNVGTYDADLTDPNVGTYDAGMTDRNVGTYDDDTTIEVREETLAARTREVERGAVRIEKDVIEEQQTLEVPVTEEEVHVQRRAVDRPADGIDLEETTIEVPLRVEEVELTKNTRVVEEIDIDKTARQHTETVSGTVRREEVDIESDFMDVDRDGTRLSGSGDSYGSGDDRGLLDKATDALGGNDNNRNRNR